MPTIGVIGGMGSEATALFYSKLVAATPARCDQEHLEVVIYNNPNVPDRTNAIINNGPSPVGAIIDTGKKMSNLNITIGCIPCITSHAFFDEIQELLPYPLINIVDETKKYINSKYPAANKIGVLATAGTVKAKIFNKYFNSYEIVYPVKDYQNKIMNSIYSNNGIKAGNTGSHPKALLDSAGNHLIGLGAQVIVAGCTELPLVIKNDNFSIPLIDPLEVVAKVIVARCMKS